ncbi:MAG: FAM210A/B-like domain-containing protein [Nannocystales bacterium]
MSETTDKPVDEPEAGADKSEAEAEPTGTMAKLKGFFSEYGPLGITVWFTIFFGTWGAFLVLLNAGVDLGGWLSGGDGGGFFGRFLKTGGVTALAYGATQVVKPIRIIATFAITPPLHSLLLRIRGKQEPDS